MPELNLFDPDAATLAAEARQRMQYRHVSIEAALALAKKSLPDIRLAALALSAAGVASAAEERLLVARAELDQAVAELEKALRIEELVAGAEEGDIEGLEERAAIQAAEGVSP